MISIRPRPTSAPTGPAGLVAVIQWPPDGEQLVETRFSLGLVVGLYLFLLCLLLFFCSRLPLEAKGE